MRMRRYIAECAVLFQHPCIVSRNPSSLQTHLVARRFARARARARPHWSSLFVIFTVIVPVSCRHLRVPGCCCHRRLKRAEKSTKPSSRARRDHRSDFRSEIGERCAVLRDSDSATAFSPFPFILYLVHTIVYSCGG